VALTLLPEQPISLHDAHNWATYKKSLERTPLAHKYLRETLRSWVEVADVPNPLVLPWIRSLVNGDLEFLERFLIDLESEMGESNLGMLLDDLLRKKGSASDIRRDIASLWGEIMAFRYLRDLGANEVKKITARGDWLADDQTVSVKTILDIDHNYGVVEDALEGYAYLDECPTIRQLAHVRVKNGRGLDYEFMAKVLRLIDMHLEKILAFLVKDLGFPDWYFSSIEVEALRIPEAAHADESGRLLLKATRHDHEKMLLTLDDIRAGKPANGPGHGIELEFELGEPESPEFSTTNDLNTWSGMPQVDKVRLGRQISGKICELVDKNAGKNLSEFAAWINIAMHPSLQQGVATQNDEFRDFLANHVGEVEFSVVVYAYGGFELAKPVFANFGPPLRFSRPT
jgi:hypothetical protein